MAHASLQNIFPSSTFTPTVTLVGGAGNTTPVYSTNSGRYIKIGNFYFCDVNLSGDGGAEGAGTGRVNIALPATASASQADNEFPIGGAFNNATFYTLFGAIAASGTTVKLFYLSAVGTRVDFTGADQNNTSRIVRLKFFYEAA